MHRYQVWFRNSYIGMQTVWAKSRKEAVTQFAREHGVEVSSYIAAKRVDPTR